MQSYCRSADREHSAPGTINVSHILTGRCVAKLVDCAGDGSGVDGVLDTLRDVTALHFSEERNELYVGDRNGILHVYAQ